MATGFFFLLCKIYLWITLEIHISSFKNEITQNHFFPEAICEFRSLEPLFTPLAQFPGVAYFFNASTMKLVGNFLVTNDSYCFTESEYIFFTLYYRFHLIVGEKNKIFKSISKVLLSHFKLRLWCGFSHLGTPHCEYATTSFFNVL